MVLKLHYLFVLIYSKAKITKLLIQNSILELLSGKIFSERCHFLLLLFFDKPECFVTSIYVTSMENSTKMDSIALR